MRKRKKEEKERGERRERGMPKSDESLFSAHTSPHTSPHTSHLLSAVQKSTTLVLVLIPLLCANVPAFMSFSE